jgi:ABC-type molybdate transport system substrate-binding protein
MTMDGTAIARVVQHLMGRIAMVTMVTAGMIAAPSAAGAASERLFAAGSLRDAFIVLIAAYKESSGVQLEPVFGPSGKLREQIQRGDVPAVFASAAIEHTDVLLKAGILRESVVLARNRLCILAAPGPKLDANRLVDTLLDPQSASARPRQAPILQAITLGNSSAMSARRAPGHLPRSTRRH